MREATAPKVVGLKLGHLGDETEGMHDVVGIHAGNEGRPTGDSPDLKGGGKGHGTVDDDHANAWVLNGQHLATAVVDDDDLKGNVTAAQC